MTGAHTCFPVDLSLSVVEKSNIPSVLLHPTRLPRLFDKCAREDAYEKSHSYARHVDGVRLVFMHSAGSSR